MPPLLTRASRCLPLRETMALPTVSAATMSTFPRARRIVWAAAERASLLPRAPTRARAPPKWCGPAEEEACRASFLGPPGKQPPTPTRLALCPTLPARRILPRATSSTCPRHPCPRPATLQWEHCGAHHYNHNEHFCQLDQRRSDDLHVQHGPGHDHGRWSHDQDKAPSSDPLAHQDSSSPLITSAGPLMYKCMYIFVEAVHLQSRRFVVTATVRQSFF